MVNIDTVYQKVLVFANKEQRGYITPQEFNLFANQAQLEIIEQYFYDLSQFDKGNGNSSEYSDIVTLIQEKIGALTRTFSFSNTGELGWHVLPSNCYKIGTVYKADEEIDEITFSEYTKYRKSRLTTFTFNSRGYVVQNHNPITNAKERGIQVYPADTDSNSGIKMTYVETPEIPKWSYVVVQGKALYDPSAKVDFSIHPADETQLVYKILKFAGVAMQRNDIMSAGQGLEALKTQQEKQ